LVEETRVSGENHRPVASYWQTISHNTNLNKQKKKEIPKKYTGNNIFSMLTFWSFHEGTIFSSSIHLGLKTGMTDTNYKLTSRRSLIHATCNMGMQFQNGINTES
jgi:hypothetical protein